MIDTWLYSWLNIWYYNRLISLLLKLGITCYHNICTIWLIFIAPYSLLITVLFMSFSYPVYLYDSIIVCSHVICTCIFSLFYTLIGSSDFLNLHIQVYGYFSYSAGIWEDHVYLSTKSLLLDHQIFWYSSCLSFHSVDFLWFLLLGLHIVLHDLFIE